MDSRRSAPLSDKSNAASEPERRASDGPKRERSPLPADVPPTRPGPEGAKPPASGESPLASPSSANAATAAGGGKKRALVEQAPRPVTRELPEALAEWKDYAEGELRQLLTVGIKAVTGLRNYVPFIVHSIHRRASRPGVALGHADRLLRLRTLYMSDDARDLVAIVGERYKEDVARFGYVFPENSSAPTLRT